MAKHRAAQDGLAHAGARWRVLASLASACTERAPLGMLPMGLIQGDLVSGVLYQSKMFIRAMEMTHTASGPSAFRKNSFLQQQTGRGQLRRQLSRGPPGV